MARETTMCDIVMLIVGIITLVRGRLSVTRSREVRGPMAYVIGLIFIAPFPLAFVAGMVFAATNPDMNDDDLKKQLWPVMIGIVVTALILGGSLAFTFAKPKVADQPRPTVDYDDYDDGPDQGGRDYDDEDDRPRRRGGADSDDFRPRRGDDLDERAR